MLLITACIKYSQHQQSNKEKVSASSIRALGFVAQNLIILEKKLEKKMKQEPAAESGDDKVVIDKQIEDKEEKLHKGLLLEPEFIQGAIYQIIDMIIAKLRN